MSEMNEWDDAPAGPAGLYWKRLVGREADYPPMVVYLSDAQVAEWQAKPGLYVRWHGPLSPPAWEVDDSGAGGGR